MPAKFAQKNIPVDLARLVFYVQVTLVVFTVIRLQPGVNSHDFPKTRGSSLLWLAGFDFDSLCPQSSSVHAQLGPGCPTCPGALCNSTNVVGSFVPVAGTNPVITHPPTGGFTFSATSSVTFDCTTAVGASSGCGICTCTLWATSLGRGGTPTQVAFYTLGSSGTCGSIGNVLNIQTPTPSPQRIIFGIVTLLESMDQQPILVRICSPNMGTCMETILSRTTDPLKSSVWRS